MVHIIRQPIQPDQFYRDHPCNSLTGTTHQIAIDDTFLVKLGYLRYTTIRESIAVVPYNVHIVQCGCIIGGKNRMAECKRDFLV